MYSGIWKVVQTSARPQCCSHLFTPNSSSTPRVPYPMSHHNRDSLTSSVSFSASYHHLLHSDQWPLNLAKSLELKLLNKKDLVGLSSQSQRDGTGPRSAVFRASCVSPFLYVVCPSFRASVLLSCMAKMVCQPGDLCI